MRWIVLLLVAVSTPSLAQADQQGAQPGLFLLEAHAKAEDAPRYPPLAREHGIRAEVLVNYVVSRSGQVSALRIEHAPDHRPFALAVETALKDWQYDAAHDLATCRNHARSVRRRISFELDADGKPMVQVGAPEWSTPEGSPQPTAVLPDIKTLEARAEELGIAGAPWLQALPAVISRRGAVYPMSASRRKIEGYANIEFDIADDGSVVRPRVADSDPPGVFEENSLRAVSEFRFAPPGPAARRVACQRINFTMDRAPNVEDPSKPRSKGALLRRMPLDLQKRREAGQLRFSVPVDEKGKPGVVEVLFSDPPGLYDAWVRESIAKAKFEPAVKDGRPIAAQFEGDFTFFGKDELESLFTPEPSEETVAPRREKYPALRALCPDPAAVPDDALNRALISTLKDALTLPAEMSVYPRTALREYGMATTCLYSQRRHFGDPEVARLAASTIGGGITFFGDFGTGFQELAAQLEAGKSSQVRYDTDALRDVQQYLVAHLQPAYQLVLKEWAETQPPFAGPSPAAQAILDAVRAVPLTRYDHRLISQLESGMATASSATDRAYLGIMLSHVLNRLGRRPDAWRAARAVATDVLVPEAIRNTARLTVIGFVGGFRKDKMDRQVLEDSWRELNASLGLVDPLGL